MATFLGFAIAITPFLAVVALLRVAEHLSRRRFARHARQIALTDAIHRELGAAAAPTVERCRGGWLVRMALPLDRPRTVAAVLDVTNRAFGRERSGPFRIVLSPQSR